jgi:hypothetical protein
MKVRTDSISRVTARRALSIRFQHECRFSKFALLVFSLSIRDRRARPAACAAHAKPDADNGPARCVQPAPYEEYTPVLYAHDGSGFRVASPQQILVQAGHLVERHFHRNGLLVNQPHTVRALLQLKLASHPRSVLAAFFLTKRRHLIDYVELFNGTTDRVVVHMREVMRSNERDMSLCTPEMVLSAPEMVLCTRDIVPRTREMLSSLRSSAECALEKLPCRVHWCQYTADESPCTQEMPQCGMRMSQCIPRISLCRRVLPLCTSEMSPYSSSETGRLPFESTDCARRCQRITDLSLCITEMSLSTSGYFMC